VNEQLNGGEFATLTQEDWELIVPYLQENERLFGISIEDDLLKVNGAQKTPQEVYRKVEPAKTPFFMTCAEADCPDHNDS
jgi:hypothetical protein